MLITEFDITCLERAIQLAVEAGTQGNLPIGAVISFPGEIISEGKNSIWSPKTSLSRHAEMEALSHISESLISHTSEMTLYTTLEPCLMCAGAILLHRIGRVVYGSADPYGGASSVFKHFPPFFSEQFAKSTWMGPAMPEACDQLYVQVTDIERIRANGKS